MGATTTALISRIFRNKLYKKWYHRTIYGVRSFKFNFGHILPGRAEAESAKRQAEGARTRAKKRYNKIKRNQIELDEANSKLQASEEEKQRAQEIVDSVLGLGGAFDVEMR